MRFSRRLTLGLSLALPLAVAAAIAVPQIATAAPATHATSHSSMGGWWTTQYGWTDNSPPGPQIAHQGCKTPGGKTINAANYGGNGSYAEPLVMAWPTDLNGPFCQIGYVPWLKRYYIHADQCNPCGGQNTHHWDLWMGGDRNSTKAPEHAALLKCEAKGTSSKNVTVILSPSKTEPVTTTPLFTPPTTCNVP